MDHVAIMNKKLAFIDQILIGDKTIESRWLKYRSRPYGKITIGDTVYFKESGGLVLAKATVKRVVQYDNLDPITVRKIISKYGRKGKINLQEKYKLSWLKGKKYCILIWLENPQKVIPFMINKAGFGVASAWITISDIDKIRLRSF